MVTLLIIGSFHALYLSIIVIAKRKKVTPDYLLSAFLFTLFIAFAILYSSIKNNNIDLQLYLLDISLLLAPFFFLYIRTITDPEYKFKWKYLLHFVLYIASSSYYEYIFNNLSIQEIEWILNDKSRFFDKPFLYIVFQSLEVVIIPFYLIWSYILLKKHKKEITKRYSYYKNIDYKWLRNFIMIFAIFWFLTNGIIIVNIYFEFYSESNVILYGFSISTLLIFYLGYLGLKQKAVFTQGNIKSELNKNNSVSEKEVIKAIDKEKYRKTGLSKEDAKKYKQQLLNYVQEKKPYLNPTISLKILADDFGITSHQLSQIINDQFGDNFYDFINRFRVEEFKSKINNQEHKHYSLLSLALDCGFNSKSAFNRVFKKFTNQTPSEFIDRLNYAN